MSKESMDALFEMLDAQKENVERLRAEIRKPVERIKTHHEPDRVNVADQLENIGLILAETFELSRNK